MLFRTILLLSYVVSLWGCDLLVSVAPAKYLVEKIAGDLARVMVMVPETMSPHYYEPTLRDIEKIQGASLWFRSGEPFEERILASLSIPVVDLREGIPLLQGHDGIDSHIWMSPVLLELQAKTIAQHLRANFPEHQEAIDARLKECITELKDLDQRMRDTLSGVQKSIIISHPAVGYLCREYGLRNYSVEEHGREPSLQHVDRVIRIMNHEQIATLFVLPQYDKKGAERIRCNTHCQLVEINPYQENIVVNLDHITRLFYEHLR